MERFIRFLRRQPLSSEQELFSASSGQEFFPASGLSNTYSTPRSKSTRSAISRRSESLEALSSARAREEASSIKFPPFVQSDRSSEQSDRPRRRKKSRAEPEERERSEPRFERPQPQRFKRSDPCSRPKINVTIRVRDKVRRTVY